MLTTNATEQHHVPSTTVRVGRVVIPMAVFVAVAAGLALWWPGTGARLAPTGIGAATGALAVGEPTYFVIPLEAIDGSVELDDVRLDGSSEMVDAQFFVSSDVCGFAGLRSLPDECEVHPVGGAVVGGGTHTVLVARFALAAPVTADVGDVVVSYHDELHRRTTILDADVCLSPEPIEVDACPGP